MKIQTSPMRAASKAQLVRSSGVRVATTSANTERLERFERGGASNEVVTITSPRSVRVCPGPRSTRPHRRQLTRDLGQDWTSAAPPRGTTAIEDRGAGETVRP